MPIHRRCTPACRRVTEGSDLGSVWRPANEFSSAVLDSRGRRRAKPEACASSSITLDRDFRASVGTTGRPDRRGLQLRRGRR